MDFLSGSLGSENNDSDIDFDEIEKFLNDSPDNKSIKKNQQNQISNSQKVDNNSSIEDFGFSDISLSEKPSKNDNPQSISNNKTNSNMTKNENEKTADSALNGDDDPFEIDDIDISDLGYDTSKTSNSNHEKPKEEVKNHSPTINDNQIKEEKISNIEEGKINNIEEDKNSKKEETIQIHAKNEEPIPSTPLTKLPKIENHDKLTKIEKKQKVINLNTSTELPKMKMHKRKRQPSQKNNGAHLNILGDLGFSFDNDNSNNKIEENKSNELKFNLDNNSPKKMIDNATNDDIKPEEDFDAIESPRPPKSVTITSNHMPNVTYQHYEYPNEPPKDPYSSVTYYFENAILSTLAFNLNDIKHSFLDELKKLLDNSFSYQKQIDSFMKELEKDVKDLVNFEIEQFKISSENITDTISSEFQDISGVISSRNIRNEVPNPNDELSSLEELNSLKTRMVTGFNGLIMPTKHDYADEYNSNQNKNYSETDERLLKLYDLEAAEIRINMEKELVDKRLSIIKQQSSELRGYSFSTLNKNSYSDDNFSLDDIDELLDNLKSYSGDKARKIHSKINNDYKPTIDDILLMNTQISNKVKTLYQLLTFQQLPSSYSTNDCPPTNYIPPTSKDYSSIDYPPSAESYTFSFDPIPGYTRSGLVEDIKTKLAKIKKTREETMADFYRSAPHRSQPYA